MYSRAVTEAPPPRFAFVARDEVVFGSSVCDAEIYFDFFFFLNKIARVEF